MNRAIIWKELREQGVIAIALAVLGIGVIVALSLFIKPLQSGVNVESYVFNPGFVGVLAMVIVAGLVVGGSLFAAERENGTQPYFDLLPVSRARKWLGKTLGGLILVLPITLMFCSIGAVVGLLGPTKTLPLVAFLLLILALQMYGWGMVGSSFSKSSLTAASWGVLLAVVCTGFLGTVAWSMLSLLESYRLIPQSFAGATIVFGLIAFTVFIVPWVVSYFIYTNPDAERKRRAIVGERQRVFLPGELAPKRRFTSPRYWRVAPMFRAAFWQARRQSMGLGLVFVVVSLMMGGIFLIPGAPAVVLWPVLSFLVTVLVGVLIWKHEQDTGAQRFWIERRFPLSRLWSSKLLMGSLISMFCALAMMLPLMVIGAFFYRQMRFDPPSVVMLQNGFNLPAYLALWPVYGFVFGFVIGPLFRKPAVALAVAMMVGATAAAVWLPSFFVGGVHLWQLFLAPVLALLLSRWILWAYAAEQLPKSKYLLRIVIGAVVLLAGTGIAIGYRVWELPDGPKRTTDIDYANAKIPMFDDNLGGREIRRAASLLGPKTDVATRDRMPAPNMLRFWIGDLRNHPQNNWIQTVYYEGWRATAEQEAALNEMLEGGWLEALDQSTTLPMGVVEDATEMSLGKTLTHLKGLNGAANLVGMYALQAQAKGKPDEYVRCLRVMLHTARSLRNQGVMASQQVAYDIETKMLGFLRHWLTNLVGRDDLLRQVDALLMEHSKFFGPHLYDDMRMAEQRALRNTFISPGELMNAFGFPGLQTTESRNRWEFEQELVGFAWQVPWEKERMQRFIGLGNEREYTQADFAKMQGLPYLNYWYDKPNEKKRSEDLFVPVGMELDLSRILVALRRYELKNQKLPGKLDELVPAFLPELPTQPGQKYRIDLATEDYTVFYGQRMAEPALNVVKGRAVISNITAPDIRNSRWDLGQKKKQFVYLVSEPKK
jgi:ABC-type transport system involved in multi-copper enzyme maturation permease subunit